LGVKKIKVQPIEKVEPLEGDLGRPDIVLPEPEAVKPRAEKKPKEKIPETKAEKSARVAGQWADVEKRARLQFGMKRWSAGGKPKRGTEEYKTLLEETKRMLADGSWKTYKFPVPIVKEKAKKIAKSPPKADEK
jgi:hypothetical protein